MRYKASFLCVPCYYDPENGNIDARFGKINDFILTVAIDFWWTLGTIFESCAGYFPIKIFKGN